jgi:hypothetical protein
MVFLSFSRVSIVQRSLLATYFFSLAYCLVWVPWSITSSDQYGTDHQRLGYGWLWAGPQSQHSSSSPPQTGTAQTAFSDIDDFVANDPAPQQWDASFRYAIPDTILVVYRIVAITALMGAAFVLAGIQKRTSVSGNNLT